MRFSQVVAVVLLAGFEAFLIRFAHLAISHCTEALELLQMTHPYIFRLLFIGVPAVVTGFIGSHWLHAKLIPYSVLVGALAFGLMMAVGWLGFTAYRITPTGQMVPLDWRMFSHIILPEIISVMVLMLSGTAIGAWMGSIIINPQNETIK